jgi:hypothetical protein
MILIFNVSINYDYISNNLCKMSVNSLELAFVIGNTGRWIEGRNMLDGMVIYG